MSDPRLPDRGPERPRAEPEIIPPGRDGGERWTAADAWARGREQEGVYRIFIARPGLPSVILGLLMIGLVAAVVLLVLAGLVLIWIPVVVVGIVVALLSGTVRRFWRRLRGEAQA